MDRGRLRDLFSGNDHPVVAYRGSRRQRSGDWLTRTEQVAGRISHRGRFSRLPRENEWALLPLRVWLGFSGLASARGSQVTAGATRGLKDPGVQCHMGEAALKARRTHWR